MQNYFYIIVGASATGKGILMDYLCKKNLWIRAKKFATRAYRGEEDDIVKITSEELEKLESEELEFKKKLENNSSGDVNLKWDLLKIQENIRLERLKKIKEHCGEGKGVVYFLNGNFYGIQTSDIYDNLKYNNIVVVCSDFNAIAKIKENVLLSPYIKIIYIASSLDERELLKRYKQREEVRFDGISIDIVKKIDNLSSVLSSAVRLKYYEKAEEIMPLLNDKWNSILPYFETIRKRVTNIRLLYNRYIDHISEIDCPILNFYDKDFMFSQQINYILKSRPKVKKIKTPIFMICAAPSSGKATLMSIVDGIGQINENIVVTKKYAKREGRPTDRRDGMIAIGKNGNFLDYIEKEEDIWAWSFHNKKTEYAVDIAEIKRNIRNNKAQIFISNMGQISKARELFPDNIVILYLHATHETAMREHIIDKRKLEMRLQIQEEKSLTKKQALQMIENDRSILNKIEQSVENDLKEIHQVHESFKDNNYLIDHVLLNTGSDNDLVEQMMNLINFYS